MTANKAKSEASRPRAVLSARVKAALDHYVAKSFKSTFAITPAECDVGPCEQHCSESQEMVMLTVCSYLFRCVLLIHFRRDEALRLHLASLAGRAGERLDDEAFNDVIMERGNLCCGALNRELAEHYPHTGMSTPCLLDRKSVDHLVELEPTHACSYRVAVAEGVSMHITIVMSAFADMDFPFEASAAAEEVDTAGELEMF